MASGKDYWDFLFSKPTHDAQREVSHLPPGGANQTAASDRKHGESFVGFGDEQGQRRNGIAGGEGGGHSHDSMVIEDEDRSEDVCDFSDVGWDEEEEERDEYQSEDDSQSAYTGSHDATDASISPDLSLIRQVPTRPTTPTDPLFPTHSDTPTSCEVGFPHYRSTDESAFRLEARLFISSILNVITDRAMALYLFSLLAAGMSVEEAVRLALPAGATVAKEVLVLWQAAKGNAVGV